MAKMTKTKWAILAALGIVALLIKIAWEFFSYDSVPHQTIRLHLRLTASSIYEFRNTAGRWPTAADDLASTSLPQISPYWKTLIENGTVVIAWRGDLKPNPKENAALVMTYNNAGLFSKQGRVWVCWGDLRTEYVKEEELRAKLPGSQAVRRE